jgi:nucleoside-diphosphate-sugar epimerase
MINAMYHTVVGHQQDIQVTNSHISRAILGINDLCRAMVYCIEKPSLGIYNLSSFNATVAEIANTVADKLNCKIVDNGNTGGAYDFRLDTTLFQQTYEFKFQDTVDTILDGLINGYADSEIHFRDKYMIYNREKKGGYLTRS